VGSVIEGLAGRAGRAVGRVIGSEHASTRSFRVVLAPDAWLQLDDLVVVRSELAGVGSIAMFGVVTEVESILEGASFETDAFRAGEGILPVERVRTAQVSVTRVDPEVWVAPDPGAEVWLAVGKDRDLALAADGVERRLPIGIGRDGEPVEVDLDFFDGRKGAHLSISGISGVATKTSFALFFLRMLAGRPDLLGEGSENLRVLIFNVKGEDLLWLDRPNAQFERRVEDRWDAFGIDPGPFDSVGFWAPPRVTSNEHPDTSGRLEGVEVFSWTPIELVEEGLLRFLFTDADDARNQLSFVVDRVTSQLRRWAAPVKGKPGAFVVRQPPEGGHGSAVVPEADERVVASFQDLVEVLEAHLDPAGGEPDPRWSGRVQAGTVSAFMRRLYAASQRMGHLVRAGATRRLDRARARVTVVAIQSLSELAQRFVVGALLAETFRDKERTGRRLPLSVVVLDELNKYAPREGTSPLKEMLIDIAQRGRSLGIVLVGAQQTASRVAQEVIENAAIRVAGRLDAAEAERAEYGWMGPATRARARLLTPGTMVLSQPSIPVPLVLRFPFPPWATRREEVAGEEDPFAGL
jgi:hypothetical protein